MMQEQQDLSAVVKAGYEKRKLQTPKKACDKIKNNESIQSFYATPAQTNTIENNANCIRTVKEALLAYQRGFIMKCGDNPNFTPDINAKLQNPSGSALSLLLLGVLQNCKPEDNSEALKEGLLDAGIDDFIKMHLPDTVFDHSKMRNDKGRPKRRLFHINEVNDEAVRSLFKVATPVTSRRLFEDANDEPTDERFAVLSTFMNAAEMKERIVNARKLIARFFNDDNDLGEEPSRFETTLETAQSSFSNSRAAKSEPRILAGSCLMSFFLVALSTMCKTSTNIDLLTKEEVYNSEISRKRFQNARNVVANGVSDFVQSVFQTFAEATNASSRFLLDFKLQSIREFVDTVREKNFTPYRVCKLIDTSMRVNLSTVSQMRKLLNFFIKDSDTSIMDFVLRGAWRGGAVAKRLNMICSNNEVLDFRRLLEGVANDLIGSTKSPDEVGAKIDVGKFVKAYLREIYERLGKEDFVDGVCKFPICIDITNDGSAFAGYTFNIGGLKLFPLELEEGDDKTKLLHQLSVCVVLSIFIAKDNTDNLDKFHHHLYEYFQMHPDIKQFGDEFFIQIEVPVNENETEIVMFQLEYLFSGDMKSHGQAVGQSSLGGASTTNSVYCCPDCAKHTGYAPNYVQCNLCIEQNIPVSTPCYHESYCRSCFQIPTEYQHLQNVLTVVHDQFKDTFTRVCCNTNEQSEESSSHSNKRPRTNDNVKKSSARPKDKDVLPHDLEYTCSYINQFKLCDMYIAWLDSSWISGKNRSDAAIAIRLAERVSGFQTIFTSKSDAEDYLKSTPRVREVVLYNLDYTDGDHVPIYNNQRHVCIDKATQKELENYIKVRICHNKKMFDSLNGKELIQRLILILEGTYNLTVDEAIKTCTDLKKKTSDLVALLLTVEKYVLYFMEDFNKKVISESLVFDRLRLIICDLHMEMRIGLFLIEELLNNCIVTKFKDKFANEMLEHIEFYINNFVFHDPDNNNNATNWKFPHQHPGDKKLVGPITLANPKVVKLIEKSGNIIDEILNFNKGDQSKNLATKEVKAVMKDPENYRELFSGFATLLSQLKKFDRKNTSADFAQWQTQTVDPWFRKYLRVFGWKKVGHYVHFLAKGHIYEQLKAFKNIHKHSQQIWEGQIGIVKSYMGTHTQGGGNSGGGKKNQSKKVQESLVSSLLRYMLRSCMYVLYPDEERLLAKVAEVKERLPDNERGLKGVKSSSEFRDPLESSITAMLTDDDSHDDVVLTMANEEETLAQFNGTNVQLFDPVTEA